MVPYEDLYDMKCQSIMGCFKVGKSWLFLPDSEQQAMEQVKLIRERLLTTQSR